MSTRYEIIETCDRCRRFETIAYDCVTGVQNHESVLRRVYIAAGGTVGSTSRDVCGACVESALSWLEQGR